MPASMTMARVASSPKVSGSRMLMPASGPTPGSMPTSVPTRQPRNAYHSTPGASATEKPCSRLLSVSRRLEPEHAALERRLERLAEEPVGEERQRDAVGGRNQRVAPLDDDEQGEHQQRHRQEEPKALIKAYADRSNHDQQQGVPAVAPVDAGEPRARPAGERDAGGEQHHQPGGELGHHARARSTEAAERQLAADREDRDAERDESAAGDAVGLEAQPSTLPIECTAASTRFASWSQKRANSGASRYATSSPMLLIAALNCSVSTAFFVSARSRSSAACGVPLGANRPTHSENSTS